jgi:hypothetical protein
MGILHVTSKLGACAHQVGATPEHITGSAHASGIDVSLRQHAAAQQDGDLCGIELVIFALTAVDGFHRAGMTEDKSNAFLRPEVGEPLPGEQAFNGHHQPLTIRGNGLEEGFGSGFHVAVQKDCAIVAQNADVHTSGMPINTAVKLVLIGVESP